LGVSIDLSELEERAKQVDSITNQLKDIETSDKEERSDVNYIG
jgi:proteasome assembly chaperone (PAC2) family protein